MSRKKIIKLHKDLLKIINKKKKLVAQTTESANAISRAAAESPSMSGDREHASNSALLNLQSLKQFEKLVSEIIEEKKDGLPEKVKPPCFANLSFIDGGTKEFVVVNEANILVPDYNIISIKSPIGNTILGKKLNSSFEFKISENVFKGKIVDIN